MADADKKTDDLDGTLMSFADHLEELRGRLIKSLVAVGIGFSVGLFFAGDVCAYIAQPLLVALQAAGIEPHLYASSLTEPFVTYLKVSLYVGLVLASPWVFRQLWGFVAAGLRAHEKRYVHVFMPFSAALFILGAVFFLVVIAPISCNFFVRFSVKFKQPRLIETFITPGTRRETPRSQPPHDRHCSE